MSEGDFLQKQGTTVSWLGSGGDETLTFASLADNAGRKGTSHDWGAIFPVRVFVELKIQFGAGPTAGLPVSVYYAASTDGTNFDGALADADAACSDLAILSQLHYVGVLGSDDQGSGAQRSSWLFALPSRYGFFVVYNDSGQALSATETHHGLYVTPMIDQYQIA